MHHVPEHYRRTIRGLIRFAIVGIAAGLILGLLWTEFRKSIRYGETPRQIEKVAGSRIKLELPPGLMFETALDLKLAHGHMILLTGLLPLGFALMLHLSYAHGGGEIKRGTLATFFWLFVPGAAVAMMLMVYKGFAGLLAVRGGNFDLASVDAGLFGGSRALRGICYGTSHSIMAIGVFVLLVAVWRSLGRPRA